MDSRPKVLIWRNQLLAWSETFIKNQACALTRYAAVWAGLKRVSGLELASDANCWVPDPAFSFIPTFIRGAFFSPPRPLIEWCRQQKVRLIHAHFGPDGCTAVPLARALGVPLVVTFHGFDASIPVYGSFWRTPHVLWPYLLRRTSLIKTATKVVCVSEFVRNAVIRQGFLAERATTCYIGCSAAEEHDSVGATDPHLLFVGRLVWKKGLDDLLRALSSIQKPPPLIVVGDGPLSGSLQRLSVRLGVNARFVGKLPQKDVRRWMKSASVVIIPSKMAPDGDCEGLPTVLIEALREGKFVVASRHAGIPEAIEDGQNGLLYDEGDTAALAQAIVRAVNNPMLPLNVRQATTAQKFDLQVCTAALERIYDDAIAQSRT